MWGHYMYLVFFTPLAVAGLKEFDTEFIIEYFNYRNVKLVCVLGNDDYWLHQFSKQAESHKIALSAMKINEDFSDVLKIDRCLQQKHLSIGVVVSTKCAKFQHIMEIASQNSHLDSSHKWLILHDEEYNRKNTSSSKLENIKRDELEYIYRVMNNLNISVDADIVMATKSALIEYQLQEIFNFGKTREQDCIIERSGKWEHNKHKSSGFDTKLNDYKYYRRWDFRQFPLRMISVVSPVPTDFDPKLLTGQTPSPGIATITRSSSTMLQVIIEIHNITVVHTLAERWLGEFTLNQSRTLAATGLYYKQQDVTPILRLLMECFDKYDVLHPPVTSIETRYYYRIPTYGAGKFENQFIRPLSKGAWYCVIAMGLLCAAVLLASAKMEQRPSSGQYAVFSVLAIVCQQFFVDISIEKTFSSARNLTIIVTGLSCVLIYNYYTSSVVSWLLNGPPPSINSLQELLESPLELIFEDIGYTRSWMQSPNYYYNKRHQKIEDEIKQKKVFNKNRNAPLFASLADGVSMVKAGGYAYHTEVDSANRLISKTFDQNELCELGSLSSMVKTPLHSCVQKNSPYKEFFNWSLARLLERGIIRCIQHRTGSPSVQCQGISPRALALGGAAPAFILLAAGYLLATGIMLVERFIWKYRMVKRLQ